MKLNKEISIHTLRGTITLEVKDQTDWSSIIKEIQANRKNYYEISDPHVIVCDGLVQEQSTLLSQYDFATMPAIYLVPVIDSNKDFLLLSYMLLNPIIFPKTTFFELKRDISQKTGFRTEDINLLLLDQIPDNNDNIHKTKKDNQLDDSTFAMMLQISVKKRLGIPTPSIKKQKPTLPLTTHSSKTTYTITLKTPDNREFYVHNINIEKDTSTWGDLRKKVSEATGILITAQTLLTNNARYRKDSDSLSKNSNHCATEILLTIPYKYAFFIQQAHNKESLDTMIKHIRSLSSSSATFFKMNADTFTPDPVLCGNFLGFYYDQIKTLPVNAPLFTTTFLNHFTPELLSASLCAKAIKLMHIPDTYLLNRYQAMQDSLHKNTALGQKLYQGGKTILLMVVENLPELTLEQKQFKYKVAKCIVTNNCADYKNKSLYEAFQETRYGGSIKPNEGKFGVVNRLYNRLEAELYSEQDNDDFILVKR